MLTAASSSRAPVVALAPPRGCCSVQWAVKPTVATVPKVRASARAALQAWRIAPDRSELLLLAVSELVSNAVRHAGAVTDRLRATLTLGGGWLRLDVADGDPFLPSLVPQCDPLMDTETEGGRGLMIVGLLVAEVQGEVAAFRDGVGKVVRVRVPAA